MRLTIIRRASCVVLASIITVACGGGSPTSPTPTTTAPSTSSPAPSSTPPSVPTPTVTVAGVVTNANTGSPVGGATVRIGSRQASTDGNGYYSIAGVAAGSATITVTVANFNTASEAFTVGSTDTRRDVRIVPFWTVSGRGNTVFDMPSYVARVRVQGTWDRRDTSNFIVYLAGRLLINEVLRTSIRYDGIHLSTGGGVVRIESSTNVSWTFTQVQ